MSENYYYFYDLNEVLIDRYPAKIAFKIRELNPNSKFIFLYSEVYRNNEPENLPIGSKFFFIPSLNKEKLHELILKYPPKSLTTIAQRIPDMWLLSFFNSLNVPTSIVQHGLWSDKLQRVSFLKLIVQKFSKFLKYISYTVYISRINKIPLTATLIDLCNFLLLENKTIPETKYLDTEFIRAKKVFSFDSSWDDYYVKKYGYKINNLIHVGNPDFLLLKNMDFEIIENSVCYLCQSLVEDGRLNKDQYISFLRLLVEAIPENRNLYIKLHPRSKMEFYSLLEKYENVIFTNDLPICSHYVAHYTGLLATVHEFTKNILVWVFPEHHTPDYFKKYGSIVTSNEVDLFDFIKSNNFEYSKKDFHKEIFYRKLIDFDPILSIAKNLV